MKHGKIAFLGTGKLGRALLKGLRSASIPHPIAASVRSPESLATLQTQFPGLEATLNNSELLRGAHFVFLGVKPQMACELVASLKDEFMEQSVLISLCARLPLEKLREALGPRNIQIVRLMPNTACETRTGLLGYASEAKQELSEEARWIMLKLGQVLPLEESQMDAFTILGACAPAFFLEMADALGTVARKEGLSDTLVSQSLAQVLIGAGTLLLGEQSAANRISQIATPGGVTAEGLKTLQTRGISEITIQAFENALGKCRSLKLG